jgi:hypothetical protein
MFVIRTQFMQPIRRAQKVRVEMLGTNSLERYDYTLDPPEAHQAAVCRRLARDGFKHGLLVRLDAHARGYNYAFSESGALHDPEALVFDADAWREA